MAGWRKLQEWTLTDRFSSPQLSNILQLVHQRRLKQLADFGHLELTKHGSRHACQGWTMVYTLGFSTCMFIKLLATELLATDLASKHLS